MEIDNKIYLIFIFSLVLVFNYDFFMYWYCPYRNFKHSSWWRHKLAHIKYLIQAYNILMLVLYSKIYDKICSPTNSLWYDFMMMLDIGLLLGHPVLNCKYLHNCLKQILEQCIQ